MITLTIDNSYSRIEGLSNEAFGRLRKLLSYEPDAAAKFYGGAHRPTTKYLIDVKGYFPTGLRERVEEFLRKEKNITAIKDNRVRPTPHIEMFKFKGVTYGCV